MTKERLQETLDNIINWACEHDKEFVRCLIDNAGFTNEELKELELAQYISNSDE